MKKDQVNSDYISTKFGKLHYLSCGFQGDPLILVIHGSGPNNSSGQYEFFLFEYVARISFGRRFFIVAIDCPGYGKSEGQKSVVRTFPLQLIEEVYRCFNYTKAFALFGHSQGGSSIFNAVFINPGITQILIQDRPVCGDIKRFKGFPIPSLLIYDIEDDGHPVSQGKQLHKNLKYSDLILYKTSKEPFWISDHLWDTVLDFLEKIENSAQNIRAKSLVRESSSTTISLNDVINGDPLRRVRDHHSEERNISKGSAIVKERPKDKARLLFNPDKKMNQTAELINKQKEKALENISNVLNEKVEEEFVEDSFTKFEKQSSKDTQPKKDDSQEVNYQDSCKNDNNELAKNSKEILMELEEEEEKNECKTSKNNNILDLDKNLKSIKSDHQNPKPSGIKGVDTNNIEAHYLCGICLELLYSPVTLPCNHSFCLLCLKDMLIYQNKCPLCVRKLPEGYDVFERNINQDLIKDMKANLGEKVFQDRQIKGKQQASMIEKRQMLFMAFGHEYKENKLKPLVNQNQQQKKSFQWKLFVEQINFKKKNLIKHVEFDINYMSVGSKPIKVEKAPYILEGKGGFNFSPFIRITWHPSLKQPPYETFHRVSFNDVTGDGKQTKKFMIKLA